MLQAARLTESALQRVRRPDALPRLRSRDQGNAYAYFAMRMARSVVRACRRSGWEWDAGYAWSVEYVVWQPQYRYLRASRPSVGERSYGFFPTRGLITYDREGRERAERRP